MRYKCKLCDFTSDSKHAIASHYRYKHPKRTLTTNLPETINLLSLADYNIMASRLLEKVVEYLSERDKLLLLPPQLKQARTKIFDQEKEINKLQEEIRRFVEIHNHQIKSGKLTDIATIKKLINM